MALGINAPLVKTPEQLVGVDALILPGGESTTMSMLLDTSGLRDSIGERLADGMGVFGTCAGMILCATDVLDGRPDQRGFSLIDMTASVGKGNVLGSIIVKNFKEPEIDMTVRRNGYGRQLDSFETDLSVDGLADDFHAVFIRAPYVERVGPDVEVIAVHDGIPVLARSGRCTVASFHPELTEDTRLHEAFIATL